MTTFEYLSKSERQVGPVTEIVRLTRDRITVSYRDPELRLTPELTAKLQAFWAKRIEEMAYGIMTGGAVPSRELPALDAGTYAGMFPVGSGRRDRFAPVLSCPKFVDGYRTGPDPTEASQDAAGEPFPRPAAVAPLKPK